MPVDAAAPKKNFRWLVILALILIVLAGGAALLFSVGGWKIPSAAKQLKNPVPATAEAVDEGMFNYMKRCQSCHGAEGNGKGGRAGQLSVKPTDFTNGGEMRGRTDGELFWAITHGHRPMPGFQDKLTDTERWQLVDYLRSLSPDPGAQNPATQNPAAPKQP
jgi:mono/diheme cytochrome c family protein